MLTVETPASAGPVAPHREAAGPALWRRAVHSGWLWTAAVAALAAVLRLINLGHPATLVFDEHYYVPEAGELLAHGVEWNPQTNAADFVAHPPLGKWCIALGVALLGDNPLGWRLPSVAAGVIAVILVSRLARRLFGSTLLGVVAGLLMSLDGMHFVLSRTGILDIFLMTFILAAFACLLRSRDAAPGWRWASAALLGLAMGVKWSAIWYLMAFLILIFVWDAGARRWWRATRSVIVYLGTSFIGYLISWAGWFATDHGWRRHWLANHGLAEPPVVGPLLNLMRYHLDMLLMHAGLHADHRYQSEPWEWLLLLRPVLFYWTNDVACGAPKCDAEILLLGTPLLGWSFVPALLFVLWLAVRRRDWRAWAVLAGIAAALAPWLLMPARTKFYFYALPSEPFFVLAIVAALAVFLGGAHLSRERRVNRLILGGAFVMAIALCFAYFYPLYTAMPLTHEQWWARLWWVGDPWI